MATATTTDIRVRVLPKQREFLRCRAREVLYSGAFAAGKSRAIAIKLLARASVPGAREGLCRKHLVTLKATTLKTLLEPDGHLPPVLPEGSYTHNQSAKTIKIHGGGEIQYFGLDDPAKIGSYNLSGCAVDEAVELAEADWTQLRGRCRVRVNGLSNQIYGACNPGPPTHWLGIRFGLVEKGMAPAAGCIAIQTCSADNFLLPKDYLADLATFVGTAKLRYVDGLWAGAEHMVYPMWLRSKFMCEREAQWVGCSVGVDAGFQHPAAMIVLLEDDTGRIHVAEEWVEQHKTEPQVVTAACEIAGRWSHLSPTFHVDPSAASLRAAMQTAGLSVEKAINDVQSGIQVVRNRLCDGPDDQPRMTVDPLCQKLAGGMETYEHKVDKDSGKPLDDVVKENDDECDALRYGVVAIDGIGFGDRILPQYRPADHRTESFPIPADWPRWRALMPSESHPVACVWGTVAPVGWHDAKHETLIVYREATFEATAPQRIAEQIIELSGDESYEYDMLMPPSATMPSLTNMNTVSDEYEEAGLVCVPWAESTVAGEPARLDKVRQLLDDNRLLIFDVCGQTDRDMRLWSYRTDAHGEVTTGRPETGRTAAQAVAGWVSVDPVNKTGSAELLDVGMPDVDGGDGSMIDDLDSLV